MNFGVDPNSPWQPIHSAPNDGSEILVGFQGQFRWVAFTALAHGPGTYDKNYARPTHWVTIPTPPASKENLNENF